MGCAKKPLARWWQASLHANPPHRGIVFFGNSNHHGRGKVNLDVGFGATFLAIGS